MTVAALIAEFLAWTARHRAPETVRFYRHRLKSFGAKYSTMEYSDLTPLDVDRHLAAAGAGVSPTTRRHNAVALQALQSFALEKKLIKQRVFERLQKPAAASRQRIPTPAEVETLLAHASPEFALIYRALAQSGARPSELCQLTLGQVDFVGRVLTIRSHKTARKTGRPRLIPIGAKLEAILRDAIGDRLLVTSGIRNPKSEIQPVFLAPHGQAWTAAGLGNTHRRLRDRAGLARDLVLYLARHRFGTDLIRAGVPIKTVADLMGHSSVKTTEKYIHRDVAELGADQDRI